MRKNFGYIELPAPVKGRSFIPLRAASIEGTQRAEIKELPAPVYVPGEIPKCAEFTLGHAAFGRLLQFDDVAYLGFQIPIDGKWLTFVGRVTWWELTTQWVMNRKLTRRPAGYIRVIPLSAPVVTADGLNL